MSERAPPTTRDVARPSPAQDPRAPSSHDHTGLEGLGNQAVMRLFREKAGAGEPPRGDAATLATARRGLEGTPTELPHRAAMERTFDRDLSHVEAHVGEASRQAAVELDATAFTVGTSIAFRDAQPSRATVAHEVTHALQHPPGGPDLRSAAGARVSSPAEPAERVAREVASGLAEGTAVQPVVAADGDGPRVWRDSDDDDDADAAPAQLDPLAVAARTALPGVIAQNILMPAGDFSAAVKTSLEGVGVADQALVDCTDRSVGIPGLSEGGKTFATEIAEIIRAEKIDVSVAPVGELSAGLGLLTSRIGTHGAAYIASAIDPKVGGSFDPINDDLTVAIDAAEKPETLLELELEGTIDRLIEARAAFELAATADERKGPGAQIGVESRRALLLNQALVALRKDLAAGKTPLDDTVDKAASRITAIRDRSVAKDPRDQESTEQQTATELGDTGELLAPSEIAIDAPLLPKTDDPPEPVQIAPDEAFPMLTDAADRKFAGELATHMTKEQSDVSQLHDQVVPKNPRFDLVEFIQVFRRWFGFVSLEQEAQDPAFKLWAHFLFAHDEEGHRKDVYDLAGRMTGASGAVGRVMFMTFAASQLEKHLGGTGDGPPLPKPKRVERPVASAIGPSYQYGEHYPTSDPMAALSPSQQTEKSTLDESANANEDAQAKAFTALGESAEAYQKSEGKSEDPIAAAKRIGILGPKADEVPIHGIKKVSNKEGWAYLVDVYDDAGPAGAKLVEYDQKVMPPEVVRYLMAKRQLEQSLQNKHRPLTQSGAAVGGQHMQAGGVEEADATAARTYLQGEAKSPLHTAKSTDAVDESIKAARKKIEDVRAAEGGQKDIRLELREYLDKFFQTTKGSTERILAVLQIAQMEYGVGDQIAAIASPASIAALVKEAVEMSLKFAILEACGPLGEIIAQGYSAYLGSQGITEISAVFAVGGFLLNTGRVTSFDQARAWAFMAQSVADDLVALVSMVAIGGMMKGLDGITRERPGTPKDLLDAARKAATDPVARENMRVGMEARLKSLEVLGKGKGDAEYDQTAGLRDAVFGEPNKPLDPALDSPLPGTKKTTPDIEMFKGGRVRTFEERAALTAEIPENMRGRVIVVENPDLGDGTRVVYNDGQLRIEVGPEAGPEAVRQHVETARKVDRYNGPLGMVRKLISKLGTALKIKAGHGTAGWEAQHEIEKLEAIRDEILRDANEVSKDQKTPEQIADQLASIDAQLAAHAEQVDSFEQGRGFIAAEATGQAKAKAENLQISMPDGSVQTAPNIPGHYYSKHGSKFILTPLEGQTGPRYQIDYASKPPKLVEKAADRLTDRQKFEKQREEAPNLYGEPAFPELETALQGKSEADKAMVRKYADVLEAIHDGGGTLEPIVSQMTGTPASWAEFRHAMRDAAINDVMGIKDPKAQVARLNAFVDADPEPGSQGKTFGRYREERLSLEGTHPSHVEGLTDVPGASHKTPTGVADGQVKVAETGIPGSPEVTEGQYFAEDKAGKDPYDHDQAKRYSKLLDDGKGTLPGGQKGIIYFFQTERGADEAMVQAYKLNAGVHIAYFDTATGALKWKR